MLELENLVDAALFIITGFLYVVFIKNIFKRSSKKEISRNEWDIDFRVTPNPQEKCSQIVVKKLIDNFIK